MPSFFKSLATLNSYLGVDIGTNSIKVVEIAKSSKGPRLLNYGILENRGYLERVNEAIQTSSLSLSSRETADMLRMLFNKAGFKSSKVIASIPAFASFVTFIEIPEMPDAEMFNALKFQIPRYIPLPIEKTNIDWIKVGESKDDKGVVKQQILLTAVPNDRVAKYQEIFKLADLDLRMLEVESLSLVRATVRNDPEPSVMVDIGSRSTNIIISQNGSLKYSSQTDYAGLSLTQAITTGLGIDLKRAEELKKQRGIIVRAEEYELSTLTLPFLDAIISEVSRAKASYEKGANSPIKKIILAGGGANLLGLPKYIEDQLGLIVEIGDPFRGVSYPQEIELMEKELGPSLAVAIGLGIKEFV